MDDFSHLIGTFIAESRDFLQSMEENLLAMEEDETLADREKRVQQLFRAAHSIKGAALMFGLETVADVAHTLEDCFGILRDGWLRDRADLTSLTPDTITDLLNGVDRLKDLVDKTGRNEAIEADVISEILPVKTRLQGRYGGNKPPERSRSDSPISADIIRTIFETELPPLLDRLEAELSLVTAETQAETLAQLNDIYYQLSGTGAMLELPEFSQLVEPLRELIDSPELSPDALQKQGLAIAGSLRTARDQVLEGQPITGATAPPPAETPPEPAPIDWRLLKFLARHCASGAPTSPSTRRTWRSTTRAGVWRLPTRQSARRTTPCPASTSKSRSSSRPDGGRRRQKEAADPP